MHGDHIVGMPDLDPRKGDVLLCGAGLDFTLVPDQEDLHPLLVDRLPCAGDHRQRGVIPAESVHNNFHMYSIPSDAYP